MRFLSTLKKKRKVPGKCLRLLAWDGELLKDEGEHRLSLGIGVA